MSHMTQGEAAFQAITSVLGANCAPVNWKGLSQKQKDDCSDTMYAMYKAGMWSIESAKIASSDAEVKKYIPGMLNNWSRKHLKLNGGEKYVPLKPGSRTGSGDEQLAAMKGLRALMVSAGQDVTEVDRQIAERIEALKPKPKELNLSALPAHLQELALKLLASK